MERRAGGSVEAARHAAGEEGLATGEDAVLHCFGHEDRVVASAMAVFIRTPSKPSSMARVASEAVPTPASTMSGNFGDHLAQDAQVGGVLQAQAAADGRAKRHYGGGSGIDQTPAKTISSEV